MLSFSLRRIIERTYERAIIALFKKMFEQVIGRSKDEIISYFSNIGNRPEMVALCDNLVSRMVSTVQKVNAQTWREAARKGTMSRMIYEELKKQTSGSLDAMMREIVNSNSRLIRSVPAELAKKISNELLDAYTKGIRFEDAINGIMARAEGISRSRAKLIARTESSKANEAMTEARARAIGSNWYVWRSSHDERVRYSHEQMDGVVCSFDYPPNPESYFGNAPSFGNYHAGCCPNCRCYCQPVIDPKYDLPDSFRVSMHGEKPHYITRGKFIDETTGA